MINFPRKLKKFKLSIACFLWFVGKNDFWIIVILFFITLTIGSTLFSFYEKKINQSVNGDDTIQFDEKLYQEFINKRNLKIDSVEEFPPPNYQNPFQQDKNTI